MHDPTPNHMTLGSHYGSPDYHVTIKASGDSFLAAIDAAIGKAEQERRNPKETPMSDLTERLFTAQRNIDSQIPPRVAALCGQAANRITELEAVLASEASVIGRCRVKKLGPAAGWCENHLFSGDKKSGKCRWGVLRQGLLNALDGTEPNGTETHDEH